MSGPNIEHVHTGLHTKITDFDVLLAPTVSTPKPIAAIGVSSGAVPVSMGRIRPSAPASSSAATTRITGSGKKTTPVWRVFELDRAR